MIAVQNKTMSTNSKKAIVLGSDEGLHLGSGPGRDLIFKLTGEETGGVLDFCIVDVPAGNGPPLHIHHLQDESFYILAGQYKFQCGEETFHLKAGDFACLPAKVPHAFINISDELGRLVVVTTPGGGHKFYEEYGPLARSGHPDREVISQLFEKHNCTLVGPPLSAD